MDKPRFVHALDEGRVSAHSYEVLGRLQQQSGVAWSDIVVTSVQRMPEKQAAAMLDNIIATSIQKQHELYGPYGDRVIDVAAAAVHDVTPDRYREILRLKYKQVAAAMASKIRELGPANVSHHCADPTKRNVIDISHSSIPVDRQHAFEAAIATLETEGAIERHFSPYTSPADPAFHIEISAVGILSNKTPKRTTPKKGDFECAAHASGRDSVSSGPVSPLLATVMIILLAPIGRAQTIDRCVTIAAEFKETRLLEIITRFRSTRTKGRP